MGECHRVEADDIVGAIYVYLSDSPVVSTREYDHGIQIDFDEAGNPVGVEYLL